MTRHVEDSGSELSEQDYRRLLAFRDGLRQFLHWSSDRAQQAGITAAQHQLLLAVRGHDGAPSVSDLAKHLLLRHNSAVELVDRTAQAGLIRRLPDPEDHRSVRLELTEEGMDRLRALTQAHLEELSRFGPRLARLWSHLPAGGGEQ
ncbi:MAG: MarR family transcriptional regulator [Actinobacteria bacterium]|nr:MarR family transcriptional regulator [Actinomycetota bacterium]